MKMFLLKLITPGGRVERIVGAIDASDEMSALAKLGLHLVDDRLEFRDGAQAMKVLGDHDTYRQSRKMADLRVTETSNLNRFDLSRGTYTRDPNSASC